MSDARPPTLVRFLLISVVAHALLFSLTFVAPPPQPAVRHDDSLQVVLVNARTQHAPETAKRFAQVDLDGGGESSTPVTPTAPLPPLPDAQAETTLVEQRAAPEAAKPTEVDHSTHSASSPTAPLSRPAPQPQPKPTPPKPPKRTDHAPAPTETGRAPHPTEPLRGIDLLNAAQTIAQLQAQIDRETKAIAERPRVRHVGASTRSHLYALYLEAWRQKVEQIGTLNYPSEAKGKIYGSLILQVAIDREGRLVDAKVVRSSGHKVLDDAALRIVRLAAPFARFPPEMAKETDILVITRRWTFTRNARFATQ